jgi:hypothetical protein
VTAPVASGWSGLGLTPTGKRRLSTAHTHLGHCPQVEPGINSRIFRDQRAPMPAMEHLGEVSANALFNAAACYHLVETQFQGESIMTRTSIYVLSSAIALLASSANGATADTKKTPPVKTTTTKPSFEIKDYSFDVEQVGRRNPPQGGAPAGGAATTRSHDNSNSGKH